MTNDDIKRWAAEAGMDELTGWRDEGPTDTYFEAWPEQLRKFAELVAEDCAKVCEDRQVGLASFFEIDERLRMCAAAIRDEFKAAGE